MNEKNVAYRNKLILFWLQICIALVIPLQSILLSNPCAPCQKLGHTLLLVPRASRTPVVSLPVPVCNVTCHVSSQYKRQTSRNSQNSHELESWIMTQVACLTFHCNLQGAVIKINPLEKISYFRTCSRFLVLNRKFFSEEDSCHINSKFHYNIRFDFKITTIWT